MRLQWAFAVHLGLAKTPRLLWFIVRTHRLCIASAFTKDPQTLGSHVNGSINSIGTMGEVRHQHHQYHPDSLVLNNLFLSYPCPCALASQMSQYLHPLSVPSRHNSTCDESPYSISPSSSSAACPTRCTAQSGQYFLNIPGMPTQQNIRDADDVDKLANVAVSQGTSL